MVAPALALDLQATTHRGGRSPMAGLRDSMLAEAIVAGLVRQVLGRTPT